MIFFFASVNIIDIDEDWLQDMSDNSNLPSVEFPDLPPMPQDESSSQTKDIPVVEQQRVILHLHI